MTYQTTLQSLKRTLDLNKSLFNISDSEDYAKFRWLDFYHWDKPKHQQQDTFV